MPDVARVAPNLPISASWTVCTSSCTQLNVHNLDLVRQGHVEGGHVAQECQV
ncbi:hypothetical protein PAXRUDRAFT_826976 [Paxillus rubicundulus Ve08.2h10]|uniref:Uncharacterized protein n=1 Tax=Paxillus rubicundulus Ve08.2h10 TaxID=930991 RepID=A0A0D0E974_9AGAM|nr:hypothetical protein PAXRUDRAFT_826976 [Paxillus rubicundulus Ve08.2h10]